MKTHHYYFFVLLIIMALMGQETVRADSYSYPFAIDFSLKSKRGESIGVALEKIYASFREQADLKFQHHAEAKLEIDHEAKKIVCAADREYSGQFGETLFEFLFDYGCGMEVVENKGPGKETYVLRVSRIDPSRNYTVFVRTPGFVRANLNTLGVTVGDVLRNEGLRDEECSAAKMTMNNGQIYATARMSAVVRLWTLAQRVRRKDEKPATVRSENNPADMVIPPNRVAPNR